MMPLCHSDGPLEVQDPPLSRQVSNRSLIVTKGVRTSPIKIAPAIAASVAAPQINFIGPDSDHWALN